MTTYRQIAHRLRWWRRSKRGTRTRVESERPRNKAGDYLDTDAPTLVTFRDDDSVDIAALLAQGAIVAVADMTEAAAVGEEDLGGETEGT